MKRKFIEKKIVSILLSATLAVSSFFVAAPQTVETTYAATTESSDYELADSIQEGNILHCFDWKYTDIESELANIAEAGFTTIQTSPAQDSNDAGSAWYMLYQPKSFGVSTNGLGTKAQLEELVDAAHEYGINVVVDVVANHLRGDGTTSAGVTSSLARNYNSNLWHDGYYYSYDSGSNVDWTNRYQVTHCNIGMWDLNSENSTVINTVADYVEELSDIGVDGIRWDAAKHIGLPSEGCNFWSTVTSAASGMYNYGEILSGPNNGGTNNDSLMKEYTNYMSVTDSDYSSTIFYAIAENKPYNITSTGNYCERGVSKNKIVYWGESHDTYSNDTSNGTQCYSQNVVDRAYAILGSQMDATALYFSRPSSTSKSSILIGQKGSTHFTSSEVASVNKFHNAMVGQKEYDVNDTNNGVYAVCRGDGSSKGGATITLTRSSSCNQYVSIANGGSYIPAGDYVDKVSGNTFHVTSSTITGTVGSTGIAVFYTAEDGVKISADQESQSFSSDLTVNYTIKNAASYTITVNGTVNNALTQTYTQDSTVVITATSSTGKTYTKTYTYTYDPTEYRTIYLNVNSCSWFGNDSAVPVIKTNKDSSYTTMTATTKNGVKVYTASVSAKATSATFARKISNGNVYNEKSVTLSSLYNYYTSDSNWSGITTSYYTDDDVTPTVTISKASGTYTDDISVTVTATDATSASYTLNDTTVSFTGSATFTVSSDATLTVTAVNGTKTATASATYVIDKQDNETVTVYFTNNMNWSKVYAYTWGGTTNTSSWPGDAMTYVGTNEYNQSVYKIEIASDVKGLIFTNGSQQTVNITSGITDGIGYYLTGSSSKYSVGTYTYSGK